jgi:hypothetical protein
LLVRRRSVGHFLTFAANSEHVRGVGHRTAALEDSRLPPLVEAAAASPRRSPGATISRRARTTRFLNLVTTKVTDECVAKHQKALPDGKITR